MALFNSNVCLVVRQRKLRTIDKICYKINLSHACNSHKVHNTLIKVKLLFVINFLLMWASAQCSSVEMCAVFHIHLNAAFEFLIAQTIKHFTCMKNFIKLISFFCMKSGVRQCVCVCGKRITSNEISISCGMSSIKWMFIMCDAGKNTTHTQSFFYINIIAKDVVLGFGYLNFEIHLNCGFKSKLSFIIRISLAVFHLQSYSVLFSTPNQGNEP